MIYGHVGETKSVKKKKMKKNIIGYNRYGPYGTTRLQRKRRRRLHWCRRNFNENPSGQPGSRASLGTRVNVVVL